MEPRQFAVYCLDVGQGDATFLLPPDDATPLLVDCRSARVALRFAQLADRELERVSLLLSHLDQDHILGALEFLESFPGTIERLWLDKDRKELGSTATKLLDFAIEGAREGRWEVRTPRSGDTLLAGGDWSIDLLAPTAVTALEVQHHGLNPNMASAVVRARFKDKVALIGCDALLGVWDELASRGEPLAADMFRIPHHGGLLGAGGEEVETVGDLYERVSPSVAILSVGSGNRHDHPVPEEIEPALARPSCRVVCTQVTPRCEPLVKTHPERFAALGATHFIEPPWRHMTDRQRPRSGWSEVPCAGTTLVKLFESGSYRCYPSPSQHGRWIAQWPGRLCAPR